jgi:hypothetical protein
MKARFSIECVHALPLGGGNYELWIDIKSNFSTSCEKLIGVANLSHIEGKPEIEYSLDGWPYSESTPKSFRIHRNVNIGSTTSPAAFDSKLTTKGLVFVLGDDANMIQGITFGSIEKSNQSQLRHPISLTESKSEEKKDNPQKTPSEEASDKLGKIADDMQKAQANAAELSAILSALAQLIEPLKMLSEKISALPGMLEGIYREGAKEVLLSEVSASLRASEKLVEGIRDEDIENSDATKNLLVLNAQKLLELSYRVEQLGQGYYPLYFSTVLASITCYKLGNANNKNNLARVIVSVAREGVEVLKGFTNPETENSFGNVYKKQLNTIASLNSSLARLGVESSFIAKEYFLGWGLVQTDKRSTFEFFPPMVDVPGERVEIVHYIFKWKIYSVTLSGLKGDATWPGIKEFKEIGTEDVEYEKLHSFGIPEKFNNPTTTPQQTGLATIPDFQPDRHFGTPQNSVDALTSKIKDLVSSNQKEMEASLLILPHLQKIDEFADKLLKIE